MTAPLRSMNFRTLVRVSIMKRDFSIKLKQEMENTVFCSEEGNLLLLEKYYWLE